MKIALASPPIPKSVDNALQWVDRLVTEATLSKVDLICFPEAYVPGIRGMDFKVENCSPRKMQSALDRICDLARKTSINIILPMEWPAPEGRRNVAFVVDRRGVLLGKQTKNHLEQGEEAYFIPGARRQLFDADGVKFGIVISHEGWRCPETVRWAASRGAKIVFHPHFTGSHFKGVKLTQWGKLENPFYERAMQCRAIENTVFFASVNYAMDYQGSATTLIAPDGACVAYQPYAEVGALVINIDVRDATGVNARRYAPERDLEKA
ncbi:predicted amidohydrolase [Hahella chejuensis KCTC 2396]|uniref:Predicted amidohydrolase n=1 Tax=Hahella chejuensis (strain KCTC 2396) TaxID=349521 RepID=Q2SQI0_HAHCH|nr:carbon-nitrogen hydrolase family protein [Hahella chejuensis]ABC27094.1 predicted amidohydrolase [Hahella chejuensis KCTC 2396]